MTTDANGPINAAELLPLLTTAEAAAYYKLTVRTLKAMAADGRVPALKPGKAWRFSPEAIAGACQVTPPVRETSRSVQRADEQRKMQEDQRGLAETLAPFHRQRQDARLARQREREEARTPEGRRREREQWHANLPSYMPGVGS